MVRRRFSLACALAAIFLFTGLSSAAAQRLIGARAAYRRLVATVCVWELRQSVLGHRSLARRDPLSPVFCPRETAVHHVAAIDR